MHSQLEKCRGICELMAEGTEREMKRKKMNHFKVASLQHLTYTNNILKCLKGTRSDSRATTIEWQRNQKSSKSSPVVHLPRLSLLRLTGFSKGCSVHKNQKMFHIQ